MKTHSARLLHLAQEHQTVMQFVSALRKANLETEADLPEMVSRLDEVYAQKLAPHLEEEERNALPMLRAAGHEELANVVLAQHEGLREAIRALGQAPTIEGLVGFVHLLEEHVEFEEATVWEALEQAGK